MDDLISRAELFDELNRRGVPYNAEVNMVINGMPSAQPEIIYCKDCTRYEKKNGRCNLVEGLNVATANSFCSYAERRQKNG